MRAYAADRLLGSAAIRADAAAGPGAEQVLAIVRRYLPEEQDQGFAAAEIDHPSDEFMLFAVRPDRWHRVDCGDEAG